MTTKSQDVKPRPPINLINQSYQPSKAELDADLRIKGTFKQAIQALLRPVRIRRMRPNDVDGGQPPRVGENMQMTDTIEGKSMSRDYGEMLTDATEINGESARLKRRNNINSFISEAKGWLQHLDNRGNGPSLKEAQRIVEDLREKLDKIP